MEQQTEEAQDSFLAESSDSVETGETVQPFSLPIQEGQESEDEEEDEDSSPTGDQQK